MENQNEFMALQALIDQAKEKGESIEPYVRAQIGLLQKAHDEFIKMAVAQGYTLNNPRVGEIEVRQYSAMKQLAQQIGDPIEEYDLKIKEVQIRIFGIEFYKANFERQSDPTHPSIPPES